MTVVAPRRWLPSALLALSLLSQTTLAELPHFSIETPAELGLPLSPMADEELSEVSGQALFVSNKIHGDGTQAQGSSGVTFYRAGLDVSLGLNMNIKELELGRTGGNNEVDIWAKNVAFGCTADASGNCVASASATQLREFMLTRPYFEFALRGDNDATQREVVGLRLGAENVNGPFSIGQLITFSGYLSATANITMQGQHDVGLTCDNANAPCTGTAQTRDCRAIFGCFWLPRTRTSDGSTYYEENPNANNANCNPCTSSFKQPGTTLGVKDDHVCLFTISTECVAFSQLTVDFDTQGRTGLAVEASGKRLTQAQITGLRLSELVDDIVNSISVVRPDGFTGGLINAVLPLVRTSVGDKFKQQLATGLGITTAQLNNYVMPYNVGNLHQVMVNSSNFGLTFQKESLQYPGFVKAMPAGWGMYLPDAFTLDISDKTSVFVNNIVSSSAARDGNIIGLKPVHDNCWGTSTFC